jgi:ABC-type lipoprotein export system ATPase subunit
MASPPLLLRLIDITKRFGAEQDPAAVRVLDGVSLDVCNGESLAIIGPSGSGKSTLLHLAGTLDQPSSGRVELNGQDLAAATEQDLAAIRNRQVGFVFQAHYLLPQCSVLENVLIPTLAGAPRSAADSKGTGGLETQSETPQSRAVRLLNRVGLGARLSHLPGQLSGGEKQRAAVVRALVNRPSLLLADEPTGSLDQVSAEHLSQLLAELNIEEKITLIVVTHSRELARRMGRVFELKAGKLAPATIN